MSTARHSPTPEAIHTEVERLTQFASLPIRASTGAAGYDLFAAYDGRVSPPMWRTRTSSWPSHRATTAASLREARPRGFGARYRHHAERVGIRQRVYIMPPETDLAVGVYIMPPGTQVYTVFTFRRNQIWQQVYILCRRKRGCIDFLHRTTKK